MRRIQYHFCNTPTPKIDLSRITSVVYTPVERHCATWSPWNLQKSKSYEEQRKDWGNLETHNKWVHNVILLLWAWRDIWGNSGSLGEKYMENFCSISATFLYVWNYFKIPFKMKKNMLYFCGFLEGAFSEMLVETLPDFLFVLVLGCEPSLVLAKHVLYSELHPQVQDSILKLHHVRPQISFASPSNNRCNGWNSLNFLSPPPLSLSTLPPCSYLPASELWKVMPSNSNRKT